VNDPVEHVARSTAEQLTAELGDSGLVDEVEGALQARSSGQRPGHYLDPIALGGLIVSVANLAWVIYSDRRKAGRSTTAAELVEAVEAAVPENELGASRVERTISITVTETLRIESTDPASRSGE
jgi:hypothetical protein